DPRQGPAGGHPAARPVVLLGGCPGPDRADRPGADRDTHPRTARTRDDLRSARSGGTRAAASGVTDLCAGPGAFARVLEDHHAEGSRRRGPLAGSADLVSLHRRLIEREPEPRLLRHHELTAFDGRRLLVEIQGPRHVL